jgi:predicted secreted protein
MLLGPVTLVGIYLIVWWVVLFAVLPIGARSHHEAEMEVPGGGDPGSPVVHNLKRKAITTTWVAAIVWVVVAAVAEYALRRWAAGAP